jgi:pimeloyl-ACP methyl ester carboxylesterase
VGFSFGGLVAGHLAAHCLEDLGTLVLVGAGGLGLREGKKLPLVAWRHLKSDADRLAAHRHNLSGLMLWDQTRIDALALEVQARNAERSRINSGPFSRGDTLLEPLSRIAGQVRLRGIWGRHDVTAGGRLAGVEPILRRTDPEASVTVIEDAGHWVIFEHPERFHTVLSALLEAEEATLNQSNTSGFE